jgi:nucleotide-binding universal stress UspA family protein
LEQIIAEYEPKLKNVRMRYRIREGKVHVEIANQAKYDDVNLIICGTHGASGLEDQFIGSNAYRIVMYSKCPVITVRPNYRFHMPSGIFVLPLDSSLPTRQKAPMTCSLAKAVGAEVHLVGVYSTKLSSVQRKVNNYMAQVERYLVEEKIKYKKLFIEGDIAKVTVAYAESVDADLLAIMTEQESSTLSFLLGTYAEQIISQASMPVLSITPKMISTSSLK